MDIRKAYETDFSFLLCNDSKPLESYICFISMHMYTFTL